jgi:hypothetical protein
MVGIRGKHQIDETPPADRAPALSGQDTHDLHRTHGGGPTLPDLDAQLPIVDPGAGSIVDRTTHRRESTDMRNPK